MKHGLTLGNPYPGGLHMVECADCSFAFAVELINGSPQMESKVRVNDGDTAVSHSFFIMPDFELEMNIGIDLDD